MSKKAPAVKWKCAICGDEFTPTKTQLTNWKYKRWMKRHACPKKDCRKRLRWRTTLMFGKHK